MTLQPFRRFKLETSYHQMLEKTVPLDHQWSLIYDQISQLSVVIEDRFVFEVTMK